IYYALVEIPEAMEAVKSGYLDTEFVKHHNPGWYAELKEKGEV
ncbi:MAG: formate dehydrogenase, partial [Gammaproteobacteria bacterium]|nr:formate dehydrogenase [Gammaproteobacteria bacterium]